MKIEQSQFTGSEVEGFYSWYDAGIKSGEIRVTYGSLGNKDGIQRYTLVEKNKTAIAVDRIVPKSGQPEVIELARIEL